MSSALLIRCSEEVRIKWTNVLYTNVYIIYNSSPAKVGLIVGSSVAVVTGLALGYAKYDPQFRKKIEDSIPYSDRLLDTLLGATAQRSDPKRQFNDSKQQSLETSLMRKKPIEPLPQPKANPDKSSDKNNVDIKATTSGDKTKDASQTTKTFETIKEVKEEPEKEYTFGSNENNIDDKSNGIPPPPPTEESFKDIDLSIAKDKLAEELLNILPTDDEKLKELQKRCNDIELEYQRKVSVISFLLQPTNPMNLSNLIIWRLITKIYSIKVISFVL